MGHWWGCMLASRLAWSSFLVTRARQQDDNKMSLWDEIYGYSIAVVVGPEMQTKRLFFRRKWQFPFSSAQFSSVRLSEQCCCTQQSSVDGPTCYRPTNNEHTADARFFQIVQITLALDHLLCILLPRRCEMFGKKISSEQFQLMKHVQLVDHTVQQQSAGYTALPHTAKHDVPQ